MKRLASAAIWPIYFSLPSWGRSVWKMRTCPTTASRQFSLMRRPGSLIDPAADLPVGPGGVTIHVLYARKADGKVHRNRQCQSVTGCSNRPSTADRTLAVRRGPCSTRSHGSRCEAISSIIDQVYRVGASYIIE